MYYWDSCIFYEWLCNETYIKQDEKSGIESIILENQEEMNTILTSAITHLEVLPSKLLSKGAGAEDFINLFNNSNFGNIEINTNILILAREIRNFYYIHPDSPNYPKGKIMDMGDAIHIATAIIYNVDEFHTRDNADKGNKISLLGLIERTDNGKICNEYNLNIVSPSKSQGTLEV